MTGRGNWFPSIDDENRPYPISLKRAPVYEVSLRNPSTVDPSSSLLTSPRSPILVHSRLKGSMMGDAGLCIGKKTVNRCPCTFQLEGTFYTHLPVQ